MKLTNSKNTLPQRDIVIVLLSAWGADVIVWTDALRRRRVPVRAIIMDGDHPKQKSQRIIAERTGSFYHPHSILELEPLAIPVYFVRNHNDPHSIRLIKSLRTDLLINAGTPRIIKPALLRVPRIGVLNSHPSLLPKYRGCTAVEWALYYHNPLGATCHFMNKGVDTGPIIYQKKMAIPPHASYFQIRTAMIYHAAFVMAKGVELTIEKKLRPSALASQPKSPYFHVIDQEKLEVVRRMVY